MNPNANPGPITEIEQLFTGSMPLLLAIFVLWFVNVALVGWLAARKGRDDGAWAFGALLLGPIALLAILALPRRLPPSPTETG